jgi:anti-sigma factor RsiW
MRYSCSHCQAELTAYLHGELPPRRRKRAAQHLNGCAACYAVYRQMRDFDGHVWGKWTRANSTAFGRASKQIYALRVLSLLTHRCGCATRWRWSRW